MCITYVVETQKYIKSGKCLFLLSNMCCHKAVIIMSAKMVLNNVMLSEPIFDNNYDLLLTSHCQIMLPDTLIINELLNLLEPGD